jgi:hypothetical protein
MPESWYSPLICWCNFCWYGLLSCTSTSCLLEKSGPSAHETTAHLYAVRPILNHYNMYILTYISHYPQLHTQVNNAQHHNLLLPNTVLWFGRMNPSSIFPSENLTSTAFFSDTFRIKWERSDHVSSSTVSSQRLRMQISKKNQGFGGKTHIFREDRASRLNCTPFRPAHAFSTFHLHIQQSKRSGNLRTTSSAPPSYWRHLRRAQSITTRLILKLKT